MLTRMATTSTALRPFDPASEDLLGRVRELAFQLAREDGHTPLPFPDLCLYRFSEPRSFVKAATFGVTLGVILQGTKRLRFGAHEMAVDSTRLLVVTRDTEHAAAVVGATRDRPYLGMFLCFGPERVARALLALAEAGGPTTRESVPAFLLEHNQGIADALERLLRSIADPLDRRLLAPLVAEEILYRLLRSDAAAAVRAGVGPGADAPRIMEAMQYMRQNHAEKLNVEQIARRTAMSPSHFAHRFRAIARVSPMRYLRDVRLDTARTRLLANDVRVSEVAIEVGFESPAHFTREFKRRFGVPPSRTLSAVDASSA
jgi:AraC-like DNA-binding protein